MAIAFGVNTSTRGALRDRNAYMQVGQTADRLGYGFLSINDHVVVPRDIASRYPYSEEGTWGGRNSGFNLEQLTTLAFLAGCFLAQPQARAALRALLQRLNGG